MFKSKILVHKLTYCAKQETCRRDSALINFGTSFLLPHLNNRIMYSVELFILTFNCLSCLSHWIPEEKLFCPSGYFCCCCFSCVIMIFTQFIWFSLYSGMNMPRSSSGPSNSWAAQSASGPTAEQAERAAFSAAVTWQSSACSTLQYSSSTALCSQALAEESVFSAWANNLFSVLLLNAIYPIVKFFFSSFVTATQWIF